MNPEWKKGVSGNPNGRPKGSGNKVTEKIRKQMSDLAEGKLEEFEGLWESLAPKDRVRLLEVMLKYSVPLLSSVTVEGNIDSTQKIIKVVYENQKKESGDTD